MASVSMKSPLFFAAVLIAALIVPLAADEALLAKGKVLAFDGKLEEAERVLREALSRSPSDVETHIEYQTVRWDRDREGVLREYAEGERRAPDDPDALYLHGRLLGKSGRLEEAMKRFERCLRLAPDHKPALLSQATGYVFQKRLDEAGRAVDALLELDPGHIQGLELKCNLLLAQGDRKAFLEWFQRTMTVGQEDPAHQAWICRMWFAADTEKGRRFLHELLAKHPAAPDLLELQGGLLLAEGKHAEAEAVVKQAMEARPRDPVLRRSLANVYRSSGRLDLARAELQAAEKFSEPVLLGVITPEGEAVIQWEKSEQQLFLGMIDADGGNLEGALARFQAVLKSDPGHPQARICLAKALWLLGRAPEALKFLEDVSLARAEDRWPLYRVRAQILYDSGRIPDAHASYAAALECIPVARPEREEIRRFQDATRGVERARVKRLPGIQRPPCLRRHYCVPVAVATALTFWGRPTDPIKLSGELGTDERGVTGLRSTDAFLKRLEGFDCVPFRATPEALKSCVDQGCPPILIRNAVVWSAEEGSQGHASTVVGYDDTRGCLLTAETAFGMEDYILYEDLQPALALLVVPSGRKVDASALDREEGALLLELAMAASGKDREKIDDIVKKLSRAKVEAAWWRALHPKRGGEAAGWAHAFDLLPRCNPLRLAYAAEAIGADRPEQALVVLDPLVAAGADAETRCLQAKALYLVNRYRDSLAALETARQDLGWKPWYRSLYCLVALSAGRDDLLQAQLRALEWVSPEEAARARKGIERFWIACGEPHALLRMAAVWAREWRREDLLRTRDRSPDYASKTIALMALSLQGDIQALTALADDLSAHWDKLPPDSPRTDAYRQILEGLKQVLPEEAAPDPLKIRLWLKEHGASLKWNPSAGRFRRSD